MINPKQLNANRNNAKLGGVKTASGKSVSKYNAQKHAILRQSITDYEDGFYRELITDLEETYQPLGRMEMMLVERVTLLYVKLYRVQKAETEFIKSVLDPHEEHVEGGYKPLPMIGDWEKEKIVVDNEGYIPQVPSESIEHTSQVFGRYETTLENRLYKAMHELERLQRLRKGDNVAAPVAVDVGMGSFGEKEQQNA
jgi:hypothetical protein